jgi:hypothetical protein
MNNGLHIDSDGCIFIRETSGFQLACRESDEVQNILDEVIADSREAQAKAGRPQKHLIVDIAGIHEGVTLNATEYRLEELRESIPSWTTPYGKPIIVNHDEGDVHNIVGRIVSVNETEHNGRKALNFKAHITDPTAVEKIRDGLWQTVSQGVRVKSAVCSICGNDWAKGTWCEHDRNSYYVKPEDQDSGKSTLCTWVLGGLSGKELSFVTVPADQDAMITAIDNGKTGQAEAYVLTSSDLTAISESFGVKTTEGTGKDLAIIESLMTLVEAAEPKETNVDPENETVEGEETPEAAEDETVPAAESPVEGEENTDATGEEESEDAAGESADEDETETTDDAEETVDDAVDDNADATGDDDDAAEADAEATDDAGATSEDDLPDHDEAGEAAADELANELHTSLVSLYVERAMTSGDLTGERDHLIAEYTERSLDEMRILVTEQTKLSRFNPRSLEQIRGIVADESEVSNTDDDAAANADHVSENVIYKVKVGDEFVEFDDTQVERVTTVRLVPTVK